MKKKMILTDNAPKPLGIYSQAIQCGELLFISGQLPIKPNESTLVSDDPIAQLYQCFENIKHICASAGTTLDHALKINVYYSDSAVSDNLNKIMEELFKPPYPARIRINVPSILKHAKVEIDGIFACPK